jgi:hypothetical protein
MIELTAPLLPNRGEPRLFESEDVQSSGAALFVSDGSLLSPLVNDRWAERQLTLGASLMVVGWAFNGIGTFVSTGDDDVVYAWAHFIDAIVQTVGALIVATSDIDVDLFVSRHQMRALAFALGWIVLYVGMEALSPPISGINQNNWLMAIPFLYLLLHSDSVMKMRTGYPVFTQLVACSLALDLVATGVFFPLYAHSGGMGPGAPTLPYNLVGVYFAAVGVGIFVVYRHELQAPHSSPTHALSITIYTYLFGAGTASVVEHATLQFSYHKPFHLLDYGFAIVHLTFPAAFLVFRPYIDRALGRIWLRRRMQTRQHILLQQGIGKKWGRLEQVNECIETKPTRINELLKPAGAQDAFTLLTLACFNGHEDAVERLLTVKLSVSLPVDVSKPSRYLRWSPLFVACLQGDLTDPSTQIDSDLYKY